MSKPDLDSLVKELRNTLSKLEIALGSIPTAIVLLSCEGYIEWCNSSFDKLAGKSHIEILAGKFQTLLPIYENNKLVSLDLDKVLKPKIYKYKQNDKTLFLEISVTLIDFKKNNPSAILTINDITESKTVEKKQQDQDETLKQTNLELGKKEKIMLSLLEDLKESEDNLKEIAEELKRSNEDLEQFAYIASHDLQEPLRMVASFTQLLQEEYKDKLGKEANEYIYYAVDGATRMQNLIRDLLEYAHIEKTDTSSELVNCTDIIKQVLINLQQVIKETNAEVTQDPLPTVMGSSIRLLQLFQNLIGNAIKYRGDNPPKIHIKAERKNAEWLFSIRDNGIGIDPKHSERIFQIFQRLHGREKYSGTGIGLALCKKIVEQHKGKLWVESILDKGSTFYFTLPTSPE